MYKPVGFILGRKTVSYREVGIDSLYYMYGDVV